ncbi:DUF1326 domain-containing protein [Acidobacteria bacterium AH-259-O06]|nr:DUF1326 domain-containing protein [Acidobacteria bacterium AH-259-O06]
MRKVFFSLILAVVLLAPLSAADATIVGDYVEARTADVYTGSCFANAEVNLTGQEAIMAWRVRQGTWSGVSLDGLSVVAVIKANATLGDPFANPLPARSLIVVDDRASQEQKRALAGFAQSMAGDLLENVVSVQAAEIDMVLDRSSNSVSLRAGDVITIKTRALTPKDLLCGNEEVYYPPLTEVSEAVPAFSLQHEFRGEGLDSTWSSPERRSAFIGTFAR